MNNLKQQLFKLLQIKLAGKIMKFIKSGKIIKLGAAENKMQTYKLFDFF